MWHCLVGDGDGREALGVGFLDHLPDEADVAVDATGRHEQQAPPHDVILDEILLLLGERPFQRCVGYYCDHGIGRLALQCIHGLVQLQQ